MVEELAIWLVLEVSYLPAHSSSAIIFYFPGNLHVQHCMALRKINK